MIVERSFLAKLGRFVVVVSQSGFLSRPNEEPFF